MTYSKEQLRALRDAIADGLSPEQMLEVFNFDTLHLLDTLDNDDIVDNIDTLEEFLPTFFRDNSVGEE